MAYGNRKPMLVHCPALFYRKNLIIAKYFIQTVNWTIRKHTYQQSCRWSYDDALYVRKLVTVEWDEFKISQNFCNNSNNNDNTVVNLERPVQWLKNGSLRIEMERFVCAVRHQVIAKIRPRGSASKEIFHWLYACNWDLLPESSDASLHYTSQWFCVPHNLLSSGYLFVLNCHLRPVSQLDFLCPLYFPNKCLH
jgi:hypothetical protein